MARGRIPPGATFDGAGVHFAVVSEGATAVDLCLFEDRDAPVESRRIPLVKMSDGMWHTYVREARVGEVYGYRVDGPYDPARGPRFNPAKLLLDPWARAVCRRVDWNGPVFGYDAANAERDRYADTRDSAASVPRAVVIGGVFDWGDDRPLRVPWDRTVIYECHVKGMTALHPEVPEAHRGRYLGLAAPPVLAHLRELGVTAVELLPVHHHATELHLFRKGLVNYWGYSTLGYFAPDARYASGDTGQQVTEFKQMVRALHKAGIEVILDVVYNHTAEGDRIGPTLCMRGIDNRAWYRLTAEDPSRYEDFTGCGNTVDMRNRHTRRFVLDSLRYWVTEMRVDGFRFDLAPALAPDDTEPIFTEISADPILGAVKLIAEPWDLSGRGELLGRFPAGWAEWNSRYRDAVRRFWRGDAGVLPEFATRVAGSSDLFSTTGRSPQASLNFVTCHDGFTLADLVSYERKHNEANGEENRDGTERNFARNWGIEGPTSNAAILAARRAAQRNMLATLMLSQGVPMICGGDEVGRTQRGNNNAYCQDNDTSWSDWNLGRRHRDLMRFAREAVRVRLAHPVLRRRSFFAGRSSVVSGEKDLAWLRPDGEEMTEGDWTDAERRAVTMRISGRVSDDRDEAGRPVDAETLLVLFNAGDTATRFVLAPDDRERRWVRRLHTGQGPAPELRGGATILEARSLAVFGPPEVRFP